MPVFRAYRKIIEKNIPLLIIYIIVFICIALSVMNSRNEASKAENFTEARARMAFLDEADSSPLTEGLKAYLSRYAEDVNVEHDTVSLQDALFFQEIDYILRIPEGFTENFLSGKPVMLEKTSKPDSAASVYLDMHVNTFLNTAGFYLANVPGISQQELVVRVLSDLSNEVETEVMSFDIDADTGEIICSFFDYMSYVLLNLLILGVSTFMIVFNQQDIRRRNLCSPVSLREQNMQMLLGNFAYAIVCWGLMMVFGFVMYGKVMLSRQVRFMVLNSFVFTLVCLSISFLVGSLLKSRNALSAVTNVLSLGMCFASGVFVPRYLIGEKVLAFARIFPTYWYVLFNDEIINISDITPETFRPFLGYLGMELGIGVAVLAVSMAVIKQKR